jgi:uncharacterized membrane protein YqhA
MIKLLLHFRYIFVLAVFFLLCGAVVFMIVGVKECFEGFAAFYRTGFTVNDAERPGIFLLEALDFFTIALVFMIFALGLGRLFVFDSISNEKLPLWLRINSLTELKLLLWEAILLSMLIFCITHLAKGDMYSINILIFPGVILVLSVSLFFIRWDKSRKK